MQIRTLSQIVSETPHKECACKDCVSMCEVFPCWPTPEEALNLIAADLKHMLELTWADSSKGLGVRVLVPKSIKTSFKQVCIFLDHGKCELHSTGLKPTEGKLAHHEHTPNDLHQAVIETWESDDGFAVVDLFQN